MNNESTLLLFNIPQHENRVLSAEQGVELEKEEIPDGALGEPVTYTLAATSIALIAVAGYLYRKSKGESFEEHVEIHKPDGSIEKRTVKWKKSEKDAPKSEVIKQIVQLIKMLMGF